MENNIFRKKSVMILFSVVWAALVAAEVYFRFFAVPMPWLTVVACVWSVIMIFVYNIYLDFSGFDALKPMEGALMVIFFIFFINQKATVPPLITSIVAATLLGVMALLPIIYFFNLEKTNEKKVYMCLMLVAAGVLILLGNLGII